MHVGIGKDEIETPALLIDLDALDRNIKTMADYYRSKNGTLRPHQKGHRLPFIARKQIDAGSKGVSMTSLGLAEFYLYSGLDDILITSEVYGANKIRRLCNMSKHGDVTVGVDNLENARQLSEIALMNNARINVAVELYMGKGTCGVEPEQAKSLTAQIDKLRGLRFKGIWWHERLSRMSKLDERKKSHFAVLDKAASLRDEILDAGVDVEMISGGHTLTWNITPEYSGLSNVEVQAGSYVFSDWTTRQVEGLEVFDYALTVLTRCISRPKPREAIFDFGMNSCSDESGFDYRKVVGPKFKDLEGIQDIYEREEISSVVFREENTTVKAGDLFEIVPSHCDTTAKLFDKYYGIRDGKVEAEWLNHGRGLF